MNNVDHGRSVHFVPVFYNYHVSVVRVLSKETKNSGGHAEPSQLERSECFDSG